MTPKDVRVLVSDLWMSLQVEMKLLISRPENREISPYHPDGPNGILGSLEVAEGHGTESEAGTWRWQTQVRVMRCGKGSTRCGLTLKTPGGHEPSAGASGAEGAGTCGPPEPAARTAALSHGRRAPPRRTGRGAVLSHDVCGDL